MIQQIFLMVKVIELDKSRNKIVLSQKEILEAEQEEKKQQIFETLDEGDIIEGTVKQLAKFGAFIDVGGVDGLCHISEISHKRVEHPEQELSTGDKVEVKILKVDRDNERISLSIKAALPDPWETFMENYKEGDIVTGKVVRTVDFGAFIEIVPGVEGLCHISQLDHDHVSRTEDVVSKGQEVSAKILGISPEQKRVSLSLKEASDSSGSNAADTAHYYQQEDEDEGVKLGDMFGDLLGEIKDDEEQ